MIWTYLAGLIADPLREFLVRLSKRGLPTPDEREKTMDLDAREGLREAKEAADKLIREVIK